jgi:hypothetical protein
LRAQRQLRYLVSSGLRFDDLDAGVGRVVGLAALKTVVVSGRTKKNQSTNQSIVPNQTGVAGVA